MLMNTFKLRQLTALEFLHDPWEEVSDNPKKIKEIYILARRLQTLYNDFVDSKENGTITRWEIYAIHMVLENILMEFAKLVKDPVCVVQDEKSKCVTALDFFFQHQAEVEFYKSDLPCYPLIEQYGLDTVKLLYSAGILHYTHRMLEQYFFGYVEYLDSFDESYVFDHSDHCIGVSNPPTKFKIMPNAIYGSADCKELQNQFNYVRRKCDAFWNSIHDAASDD